MKRKPYPLITTAQLAEICGVSQGTVDRALHGRPGIREETRQSILQSARRYGYLPDLHWETVPDGRSMLLGIVVFNLWNEYFSSLVMQIERICRQNGYSAIVMFSNNDPTEEVDCIRQLLHTGVDGIALCPVGQGKEYIRFLSSLEIPVVTLANRLPGLPYVGIDNVAAMEFVTQRALEKGYRRLLYFAPVLKKTESENIYAQQLRRDGFQRAAENRCEWKILTDLEALQEELRIRIEIPTAVLCPTDLYALNVRKCLQENGIFGVGLCGFDDSSLLEQGGIPLDSVHCDAIGTAERVFARLCGKTNADEQMVSWGYIARGSCEGIK